MYNRALLLLLLIIVIAISDLRVWCLSGNAHLNRKRMMSENGCGLVSVVFFFHFLSVWMLK
jgi:hypothetical protein